MFVQLLFDASASADACWHLEIRWNMCRADKVKLPTSYLLPTFLPSYHPTFFLPSYLPTFLPSYLPTILPSYHLTVLPSCHPTILLPTALAWQVEELIKYCARRAKQAGMLLLQVPTGRRPRPFSPPVLVPVPLRLQPAALRELRTRLCFVRESSHATGDLHADRSCAAPGERWMHELGVAFVQRDKHSRGFLWSVNRLLPSQAGREHSEALLGRFREICARLELGELGVAD